ncbi:MAG TPA: TIGR00725 family protein [Geopsychrobacteraceae bacterium]|nr:TIGR00725 family protein [Geopsychrobacteraceae bacterium]
MDKPLLIGVIGASNASPKGLDAATTVGRLIAEAGAVLVCGGLGGVMEAASRGCVEAGGQVLGILPGDSALGANPFVSIPVVTDMGHARNIIIAQTSNALIAVEGEYGTLSEMAIALKLGKTVCTLDSWDELAGCRPAATPTEAVAMALNAAGEVFNGE